MGTDSTSTCDALRELVGALALGEEAWLSDDERRRAEAHVADCPACRAYMADLAAIAGALREAGRVERETEVPERILLETRLRILAAVRARAIEHRHQALESAWRRRARLGWAACAAAAVLVMGLGLWAWLSRARPTGGEPTLAQRPVPDAITPAPATDAASPAARVTFDEVKQAAVRPLGSPGTPRPAEPTLAERLAQTADVPAMVDLLDKEYQRAKEAPKQSQAKLAALLTHAQALAAKSAGTEHGLATLQLVYHCHLQLADRKSAQEAFLAYADALGERAEARYLALGVADERAAAKQLETTASAIYGEIRRLIGGNDRVLGRSLCDVLVTRYPGTKHALDAQIEVADYHRRFRANAECARLLRSVIEAAPDSRAASRARALLPTALFNAGRHDEAAQAWMDYIAAADSDSQRACGYYNAAALLKARGPRYYPQAMTMYRAIVQDYPQTNYARVAKLGLARLEKRIEDEILDMKPPS